MLSAAAAAAMHAESTGTPFAAGASWHAAESSFPAFQLHAFQDCLPRDVMLALKSLLAVM